MSTTALIHFVETPGSEIVFSVHRRCDGYPEKMIPEINEFLDNCLLPMSPESPTVTLAHLRQMAEGFIEWGNSRNSFRVGESESKPVYAEQAGRIRAGYHYTVTLDGRAFHGHLVRFADAEPA